MSATVSYSLTCHPHLLDVLDDEWRQDKLPDDDIPLPEGVQPPSDDHEDLGEIDLKPGEKEKWPELGLSHTQ
eukprot:CAMPEP_0177772884 /NCGR_PEP_ID=MMETSP0491_2-20121128/12522_1 /TAXON_ID=63592 /ORGANISM="Tetraselmis chuii, Strain PLY429" /LENGTH=71 /DNA_ID=CAMNT_0019290847 /DNA_START=79 /DNA_END=294 /DNA_ORIENTATION=-